MLDRRVEILILTEAQVITGHHRPGMLRIPRARTGAPGAVTLSGIQPAYQVAGRSPHGALAGERIGRSQMKMPGRDGARVGLSSDLDQLVVTGHGANASRHGMLRAFGHPGATALGRRGRPGRLAGSQTRAQEGAEETSRRSDSVREKVRPRPGRNRFERMLIVVEGLDPGDARQWPRAQNRGSLMLNLST